jgi:3-oxoacyl-[acyl-carrier protein] reductase
MTDLRQKVALITGSSRGIGAAIAKRFARHGAKVALHGRDVAALAAVQEEIRAAHGEAMLVTGDVSQFADLEAMRQKIEDNYGPIEILVANAGKNYTRPQLPLEEIPEDGWRAAIDGNLTATFLTLKSILPGMKARKGGRIVVISSAAARRPHPASPLAYAAAKAGMELLTQSVAAQVGPYDIRVNCIAPETILTESNLRQIPEAQKAELAAGHPLKRLGTPEDVANAALFLASDAASWISGVILDVAGGAVLVR